MHRRLSLSALRHTWAYDQAIDFRATANSVLKTRARMVTVSAIVPSYNYERFLDLRLRSVVGQTYEDIEVIVIDDASTDNSASVIASFSGDPRLKAVLCEVNSGSIYQRWKDAAAMASGRYLWFAGADDYCEPTIVEELVSCLERDPSVGIAFTQSWVVDEEGRRLFLAPAWTKSGTTNGLDACRALILDTTISSASGVIVRTDLYREVGGFDIRFRLAADWRFYIDVLTRSNLAYVAKPLNYCRMHPATVSVIARRNGDETVERYRVIDDVCSRYPALEELHDAALDREAERCLVAAANALRRGAVSPAIKMIAAGSKFDKTHTTRILRALPALRRAVWRKLRKRAAVARPPAGVGGLGI